MFAVEPPVRTSKPYCRFGPMKISGTGVDPVKIRLRFNKGDIIKPLTRNSIYEAFNIKSPNFNHDKIFKTLKQENTKWALGTVARPPNWESLPKVQQFKTYYMPTEFNNKEPERYRAYSLKTDHIGIKVPNLVKVSSKNSFLNMKSKFSTQIETSHENSWAPKSCKNTINTSSSKDYNILNFEPLSNLTTSASGMMNKNMFDRKKGVGEYKDLTKPFAINYHRKFADVYEENPRRFYKYTGIFSEMYDSSKKNGSLIEPFGHK